MSSIKFVGVIQHHLQKMVAVLLVVCLLFSISPLQSVLAATYVDDFSTVPFSGSVTSFSTGTLAEGLTYTCSNCVITDMGGYIQVVSISYPGQASITITARDAGDFLFNSIYVDTLYILEISGNSTPPFSISIPENTANTFSPSGGSKIVDQVVISNVGPLYEDFNIYIDNVSVFFGPALNSFTRQTPATTPTNADTLVFRATFSEGVQNVSTDDFTVNGTTTATVTNVSSVSTSVYDITVSGGNLASYNGTVGLDISATNNITSTADSSALMSGEPATDQTYTLDNTGPTVTINQAAAQSDPATSAPINFTVTFNESVTDFATGDVTLGGTAGATTATVTGSGTTYNVAVSGMNVDGTVTASLLAGVASDSLGNPSSASTSTDNQVTFNGDPEIDIQRPAATSIADGGTDALGNRSISSTVNLTYTVDNTAGTDTLTISGVTASSLSNVSNFSLDTPVPINVAGGSTATFDVSFDVNYNGAFSFDMNVANNDSTENPYTIALSGTGTGGAAEIDIQRPAGTSIADGGSDNVGNRAVGTVNLTYTIDNTSGTDQVSISGVTTSNEVNVSGFSLVTGTPINVAAGSTGTFDVTFNVGINGAFSFDMAIANNDADENPYNIAVSGTGTGGVPEIDVQRPAGTSIVDGGTDALGNRSISSTVTLTYTVDNSAGADTLTVSNITASGESNVSGFSLDTGMPLSIPAGSSDTFDISFDVNYNGAFSFDMDIANDDASENPYTITLSGTGTGGAPEIDIQRPAGTSIADGGSDNVGNRAIGTVNLTYTIDNSAGTDQVSISGVTASNEVNVSGFTLVTGTPINVAAGSTGTFDISFNVGINGAFSFDMAIANNDADENPYNIAVSGTGTGGAPEIEIQRPAGTSILDGGSDALGTIPTGTVNLTYTVDNSAGTGQLSISTVTATNLVNAAGFTLLTATPINIAAGDTGTFDISFSVSGAGAFSLDMVIANNDSDESNYDIAISGTGYIAPEMDVSFNSVSITDGDASPSTTDGTDFGYDLIGYVPYSPEHTFTITNTGAGTLLLTETPRVAIIGTGFSVVTDAPASIPPGGQADFVVRFAAPVIGVSNGTISIANNDTDENPYNFSIIGRGYSGPLMVVQGGSPSQDIASGDTSPDSADDTEFMAAEVAGGTVDHTFTIQNDGAGTLALNGTPVVSIGGANAADFSVTLQPAASIASGSSDIFTVRFDPSAAGNRTAVVSISNDDPSNNPYTFTIQGQGDEFLVMPAGGTSPTNGTVLSAAPTALNVQFNRDALADGSNGAANYTGNYLLVEAGVNDLFDTTACNIGVAGDDTALTIVSISYNGLSYIATLTVNSADFVAGGNYELIVCGTTSVEDTYGNELNGGTVDTIIGFSIAAGGGGGTTGTTAIALPATGFPIGQITNTIQQPVDRLYSTSNMTLEIPTLNLSLPIVGVPEVDGTWDVSWLGENAGYLAGTAYPTWKGNTVITAHVWDAFNQPGPFADLKSLKFGDHIEIHAYGEIYVYEVRDSRLIAAGNINAVIKHEELDWLTLLTCEGYQENSETYTARRLVRAVLIQIMPQ